MTVRASVISINDIACTRVPYTCVTFRKQKLLGEMREMLREVHNYAVFVSLIL